MVVLALLQLAHDDWGNDNLNLGRASDRWPIDVSEESVMQKDIGIDENSFRRLRHN
jgi:hypothetical protein